MESTELIRNSLKAFEHFECENIEKHMLVVHLSGTIHEITLQRKDEMNSVFTIEWMS